MQIKFLFCVPIVAVAIVVAFAWPKLDTIFSVSVGFTAKTVCDALFVSGRSLKSVVDHEAAVVWLVVSTTIDTDLKIVRSRTALLPVWQAVAKFHSRELGCGLVDERSNFWMKAYHSNQADRERVRDVELSPWPVAEVGQFASDTNVEQLKAVVGYEFSKAAFKHNQTRAVVIVYKGHILLEEYQTGELNITAETRLLGWSMTKTVMALLVGIRIGQGRMSLDDVVGLHDNNGSTSTVRDLLRMADLLSVPEDVGYMGATAKMLFASHSPSEFLESYLGQRRSPLGVDGWYYNCALTNLLSSALRQSFDEDVDYWAFPHMHLFNVIGAMSFVLEVDRAGNFLSSSFSYATANDWARIGQLILQNGKWGDRQLVPEWYMDFVREPFAGSGGMYGAQIWMNPVSFNRSLEGLTEETLHELKNVQQYSVGITPADTLYLLGHFGQRVAIIPSMDLVIVRLGFTEDVDIPFSLSSTPDLWQPQWSMRTFLKQILDCFQK